MFIFLDVSRTTYTDLSHDKEVRIHDFWNMDKDTELFSEGTGKTFIDLLHPLPPIC